MKKLFLIIPMLLLLSGCQTEWDSDLLYRPTRWESDNVRIDVKENYILNQGHSYDVVETDNGYDMVVHFVEVEDG